MKMNPKNWIPKEWTFKNSGVASHFDRHVREQLPWYDLATRAVAHIAKHYIPNKGVVYDIGASTGNVGNAIRDVLEARRCKFTAIEESREMARNYVGPKELVIVDAQEHNFEPFDFATCFLTLMFLPVKTRSNFLLSLESKINPGGCLVIVDKIITPPGYVGTCIRRLAMRWKLEAGTPPEEVLKKELSLAGYQRPIDPAILSDRKSTR